MGLTQLNPGFAKTKHTGIVNKRIPQGNEQNHRVLQFNCGKYVNFVLVRRYAPIREEILRSFKCDYTSVAKTIV